MATATVEELIVFDQMPINFVILHQPLQDDFTQGETFRNRKEIILHFKTDLKCASREILQARSV